MADWTILCDFDGTAAVDDTTDTLLEAFGRRGWELLEDDWRAGRIGSHDCMAGQVALLDMDRAQLDAHLGQRQLDSHFPEFVNAMQAQGIRVEILSDGLEYAIRTILARYGLDWLPITANALHATGERQWELSFPNASAECRVSSGTCKCARAARVQETRKRVLLIGDGASDFCVAEAADFVFAKGKLIAHCIAKKIPHQPIRDFADVLRLMSDLVGGRLVSAPTRSKPVLPRAVSA